MAHRGGTELQWGLFPTQGGVFCLCPCSLFTSEHSLCLSGVWEWGLCTALPTAPLIPERVPCSQFHLHIRHPAIFSLPWFTGQGGCANPKEPPLAPQGVQGWLGQELLLLLPGVTPAFGWVKAAEESRARSPPGVSGSTKGDGGLWGVRLNSALQELRLSINDVNCALTGAGHLIPGGIMYIVIYTWNNYSSCSCGAVGEMVSQVKTSVCTVWLDEVNLVAFFFTGKRCWDKWLKSESFSEDLPVSGLV